MTRVDDPAVRKPFPIHRIHPTLPVTTSSAPVATT
jgi:hypothetical protein